MDLEDQKLALVHLRLHEAEVYAALLAHWGQLRSALFVSLAVSLRSTPFVSLFAAQVNCPALI